MPRASFTAHFLELPHIEPTIHAELHGGDLYPPIWVTLDAGHIAAHGGTLNPPIWNYLTEPGHVVMHDAPISGTGSLDAGVIEVTSSSEDEFGMRAAPFRPGRVRRLETIGPWYEGTGQPVNLVAGDLVVYSTASSGELISMELNYSYGVDWMYESGLFRADVGMIRVLASHSDFFLSLIPTLFALPTYVAGVAAIYRDATIVGITVTPMNEDVVGEFPELDYRSPDGVATWVRAFSFCGTGYQAFDATVAIDPLVAGASEGVVSPAVALYEQPDAVGPPAPAEPYTINHPNEIGMGSDPTRYARVVATTVILGNLLLPDITDDDNPAPVGATQLPV